FGSSFPLATASEELAALPRLKVPGDDTTGLLALFGHADPTGDTALNKTLSGRRALAMYGLLVRDVEIWDRIHQDVKAGDRWGVESLQLCLAALGYLVGPATGKVDGATKGAVKRFKHDEGLGDDDRIDPTTRKALFRKYMDHVAKGPDGPVEYAPTDFFGRG